MHLIQVLASGVVGAGNGTAEIYVRGTSTHATYYTDFEGQNAVATGADVSLDANGGAEIYVNQYVDVTVKNSSGTEVRSFTAGDSAPNIEYIGQSFTGVDYDTGASVANKPVTLQTILDAWYTSAGALDFEVLLSGSSTGLQVALDNLAGYFFNVTSAVYGAEGDGTTDDTTAVQAALTAANTAGGGVVFFPKGTYRITSALSLPNDVSLLGVGPYSSILSLDHATNNLIETAGSASGGYQLVKGIGLQALQSTTGLGVYFATETNITFTQCSFGNTYLSKLFECTTGIATAGHINFDSCEFTPGDPGGAGSGAAVDLSCGLTTSSATFVINNCYFKFNASHSNANFRLLWLTKGYYFINNCIFDASEMTNAISVDCIYASDSTSLFGCLFMGSSTATVGGIVYGAGTRELYDYSTFIDANMNELYNTPALITGADDNQFTLYSRESKKTTVTDNSATVTLESDQYGLIQLIRTSNAVQSIEANVLTDGSYFTLMIYNNSGGVSGNISFSSTYFRESTGTFTIADANVRIFHFRSVAVSTTEKWCMISDSGDMAI